MTVCATAKRRRREARTDKRFRARIHEKGPLGVTQQTGEGITTDAYSPTFCHQLFSSSAFGSIVNSVTGGIGKLSDDKAAEFAAAAGAEKEVLVARMQADSQAYQTRVALLRGMFWLQVVLLFAYAGPVWHLLLVYLDTVVHVGTLV